MSKASYSSPVDSGWWTRASCNTRSRESSTMKWPCTSLSHSTSGIILTNKQKNLPKPSYNYLKENLAYCSSLFPHNPQTPMGNFSPKSISTQVRQQLIYLSCYFKVCLRVLMSSQTDSLLLSMHWLDRRDKYLVSQAQNATWIVLLAIKGRKKKKSEQCWKPCKYTWALTLSSNRPGKTSFWMR